MTRFARARGSKAANQKLPGEATKWSEMKTKAENEEEVESEEEEVEESAGEGEVEGEAGAGAVAGAEWAQIEAEEEESGTENEDDADSDDAPAEVSTVKTVEPPPKKTVEGPKRPPVKGKPSAPPRKAPLQKPKTTEGRPRPAPLVDHKPGRKMGAERGQRFCFLCREAGHMMAECPSGKEKSRVGICFKCGSTEHRAVKCKVQGGFKFARCFHCEAEGHIARECPDNPRGLYPQGGACRECGDVTHYKKDCPKLQKAKAEKLVTLKVANKRTAVDALDEDEPPRPSTASPAPRKVVKI